MFIPLFFQPTLLDCALLPVEVNIVIADISCDSWFVLRGQTHNTDSTTLCIWVPFETSIVLVRSCCGNGFIYSKFIINGSEKTVPWKILLDISLASTEFISN